jgi:peptidoglycan L-alanyl-D-glutamate endopeptidase CwlK
MFSFSDRSLDKLKTCDKRLQAVALLAIQLSEIDFGISEGERSIERQQELYEQGRTKPGKIVTWVDGVRRKSQHNYSPSRAFDVFAWVDGVTWEEGHYYEIARAVKEASYTLNIPITWGGDWPKMKRDLPHYQLALA